MDLAKIGPAYSGVKYRLVGDVVPGVNSYL